MDTVDRLHMQSRVRMSQDESAPFAVFPDGYQLRPDIALTEPEQLNNLIQLSRGLFAASV